MSNSNPTFILGSRSPQRLELLQQIVPAECIDVLPPRSTTEAGFAGTSDWKGVQQRLAEIARSKCGDVLDQLADRNNESETDNDTKTMAVVIAADTVIVGLTGHGSTVVLEQPPEDDSWPDIVRRWFGAFYFGRSHIAATALCVATLNGKRIERVVRTDVTFHSAGRRRLEWYLSTGEPRGKAGGYAIQGAGSIFIERIDGSLSNVIGLPLEALLDMFEELDLDITSINCGAK